MAHKTARSAYKNLVERLNQFPQGAPPSETLYKILEMLFSEKEAEIVAQLPIRPFTVEKASRILKKEPAETEKILDELASRAILLDSRDEKGEKKYILPPPMAGFFEFSMMRVREDLDQELLAELYHQYLNVEEDFIRELFLGTETKPGRVFVQEEVLSRDNLIHTLDFERASHIIESAEPIAVSTCYCRHEMHHLDQACDNPLDICLTFNTAADSLIRHDHARRVDTSEGLELLHKAREEGLVQFGENVREEPTFICNCCGCCCEALVAVRKFGSLNPVETSAYKPQVDHDNCTGCGRCIEACHIDIITFESATEYDARDAKRNKSASVEAAAGAETRKNKNTSGRAQYDDEWIEIDQDICLGCGVCVQACPGDSLQMIRRGKEIITPVNSVHKTVMMAIEKGQLANLIFENQAFASHRAMAAVLSAILKMPPVKQAMASEQLKSRYLGKLIKRLG